MNEQLILINVLDRIADETKKQSQKDQDVRRKAYKAGKADGLAVAKDLLKIISRNGHAVRDHAY